MYPLLEPLGYRDTCYRLIDYEQHLTGEMEERREADPETLYMQYCS